MAKFIWGIAAAAWGVFFLWYTDLGGPLTEEEIAGFEDWFASRSDELGGSESQRAQLRAFMTEDTGRQFFMVNVIDMEDNPEPIEGFEGEVSGEAYSNHYMEHMWPQLLSRGCHPIFAGNAVSASMDLHGIEGAEVWDRGAIMRYKSRRALMEVITHPDMNERHAFKIAGMTKTIAYPVESVLYYSDPRFLVALILGFGAAVLHLVLGRR